MKHLKTGQTRGDFKTLAATRSAQAILMTLQPGQSTGEPSNEHPRCDQWLLVLSGTGRARVNSRRLTLRRNSLLLIEKGEIHQIVNSGKVPLRTLNFYAPPAYQMDGKVRRSATR